MKFADGGLKSTKSTIFIFNLWDFGVSKVDLLWTNLSVVTSTANTTSADATSAEEYIMMSFAFLHAQIKFDLKQIVHANDLIIYYED